MTKPAAEPLAPDVAFVRLQGWLSPAFPVGAFAYSHGLESAFDHGVVHDRATLADWLRDLLAFGSARCDAGLLVCAHRAASAGDGDALAGVAAAGATLFGAPELARESRLQGDAFWQAIEAGWPHPRLAALGAALRAGRIAYPVAVGVAAAAHGIAVLPTAQAFLHGFAANGVSAAIRLGMLGQTDGQRVLRAVEPSVLAAAEAAQEARLEDLGSAAVALDLLSLAHESQTTRLFRS